jgi:uncharacterized membrane protein
VPAQHRDGIGDARLEVIIGRLLRAGVVLAAVVSAVAVVLYIARGSGEAPDYRTFHGEPTRLRTVHGIVRGAAALRARALMQLGLLILVATPVARVALSVVGFALERDRLYVAVTLGVLALLLLGLLGFGS